MSLYIRASDAQGSKITYRYLTKHKTEMLSPKNHEKVSHSELAPFCGIFLKITGNIVLYAI